MLIFKTELVKRFSNLRPISLSNFMNKIIFRVIYVWMSMVLHKIISITQSGFVKGMSFTKNFLLAHEIIKDIHMKSKNVNIVA